MYLGQRGTGRRPKEAISLTKNSKFTIAKCKKLFCDWCALVKQRYIGTINR